MFSLFSLKGTLTPGRVSSVETNQDDPVPFPVINDVAIQPEATETSNIIRQPQEESKIADATSTPTPSNTEDSVVAAEAEHNAEALLNLISSVPAKILHAYTLSHLSNASPHELSALVEFFDTLAPPQLLHCVRCHKDYHEIDNDDRSCLVAHDDDSAEVERIGVGQSRKRGPGGTVSEGATYETLWGCCAKIVEGDGDQGPPDGWCYEGKHTVDIKRARFRADSTPQDDKLVSCLHKNCHNIPNLFISTPGTTETTDGPSVSRKRTRSTRIRQETELADASGEDEANETDGGKSTRSTTKAAARGTPRGRTRKSRLSGLPIGNFNASDEPVASGTRSRSRSRGPPVPRTPKPVSTSQKPRSINANAAAEQSEPDTAGETRMVTKTTPSRKKRRVGA